MNEEEFWSIIKASRVKAGCQDAQAEALETLLAALPVEKVESFEIWFWEMMVRSYRWDLWAAAYLILGGCSDDGFDYFRFWLISMGRKTFEAAVANPDSLADIDLPPCDDDEALVEWEEQAEDPGLYPEFEDFALVASHVWEEKTGKDSGDMPTSPSLETTYSEGPAGEPWDEDDTEYFAKTFPRLWDKYGW